MNFPISMEFDFSTRSRLKFGNIMSSLALQRGLFDLNSVDRFYCAVTYDGLMVYKNFIIQATSRISEKLGHVLALLKRIFENSLIPLSSSISVISADASRSSLAYICDSVVSSPPPNISVIANNPLAILPFLMKSNRIGISLGIACCQSIVALDRIKNGSVAPSDLVAAIVGVLVNMSKSAATSKEFRYLTSVIWAGFIDDNEPDDIFCMIQKILRKSFDSIDSVVSYMQTMGNNGPYSLIFGRIGSYLGQSVNDPTDDVDDYPVIAILSEQMNLFDIFKYVKNNNNITILYTPLAFNTRLLLQSVVESISDYEGTIEYKFHTSMLPRLLELSLGKTIEKIISAYDKPVRLLPGGGTLNYLMALRFKKEYGDDLIISP